MTVIRSKSGKRHMVQSTLCGVADGPMVFDLIEKTNISDQLLEFIRQGDFDEKCQVGYWATCPSMTSPSKHDAERFAEFLIGVWSELLQSYPDAKTMHNWEMANFHVRRIPSELPPWIPQKFRKASADA